MQSTGTQGIEQALIEAMLPPGRDEHEPSSPAHTLNDTVTNEATADNIDESLADKVTRQCQNLPAFESHQNAGDTFLTNFKVIVDNLEVVNFNTRSFCHILLQGMAQELRIHQFYETRRNSDWILTGNHDAAAIRMAFEQALLDISYCYRCENDLVNEYRLVKNQDGQWCNLCSQCSDDVGLMEMKCRDSLRCPGHPIIEDFSTCHNCRRGPLNRTNLAKAKDRIRHNFCEECFENLDEGESEKGNCDDQTASA
jgi:hypothetical protein